MRNIIELITVISITESEIVELTSPPDPLSLVRRGGVFNVSYLKD